jgi:methylenetetrahydrofolate reductase (NADPH)
VIGTTTRPTERAAGTQRQLSPVRDALAAADPAISFEFFPPKTDEGERLLWTAIRELEGLKPSFVSVTYGAGGSTRDRTVRVTGRIVAETTLDPIAHLTCVDATVAELRSVIGAYADVGIRNVLCLRGDPAGGPGTPWTTHEGGLAHADELVALVRSLGDFCVGVAAFPEGHPESASLDDDARVLLAKQRAGAEFAITQFFFDIDDYLRLRDRALAIGATLPIVPGIMPITDERQVKRFAELSGSTVPQRVVDQIAAVSGDADAVRAVGIEIASQLCQRLLDEGAPGLHFYTLNRSTATREIAHNLGVNAA